MVFVYMSVIDFLLCSAWFKRWIAQTILQIFTEMLEGRFKWGLNYNL